MIEQFIQAVVKELGVTGLLVLILSGILWNMSREIAKPLKVINKELGEIRDLLKNFTNKKEK